MFNPSQVIGQINTIISTIEGVLPVIQSSGVAAHTVGDIRTGLDDAKAAAGALANADAGGQAQSIVDRIGADLAAVLATLTALPLPLPAILPVRIAAFLVPVIVGVADMIWPPRVQPPQAAVSGG